MYGMTLLQEVNAASLFIFQTSWELPPKNHINTAANLLRNTEEVNDIKYRGTVTMPRKLQLPAASCTSARQSTRTSIPAASLGHHRGTTQISYNIIIVTVF